MRIITRAAWLAAFGLAWVSTAHAAPMAYVPNSGSSTVSVIDTATDTVVDTIGITSFLQAATVSPNGLRAYTSSISNGSVYAIDAFTNTVAATIPVSYFGVYSLALNPSGSRLYATGGDSKLAVIDTATNTVLTYIADPAFDAPQNVVVTPDGAKAYVTNAFGGKIAVVDTASNTVLISLSTFTSTRGIDVLPSGTKVYATEDIFGVRVIDTATDTFLPTISVSGAVGVAVHPSGAKVYVSTSSGLTVIDATTDTVITSVPLGSSHFGLSVHPDGSRVYVASMGTDEVFVVDTATNTSLGSIPVGDEPFARGLFIGPDFVCGDGTLHPGEECDDGNVADGDGCSSTCLISCDNAAVKQKVIIAKLDTPVGDDRLTFSGQVTLPAAPSLNPIATGIRVILKHANGTLLDATLPGGAFTSPGPGWKINAAGNTWTYLDKTISPIENIFKAVVSDKSASTPGLVKFLVKGKKGAYPVVLGDLPVSGIVILDPTNSGGECAGATFPGPDPVCAFNASGTTLKCK